MKKPNRRFAVVVLFQWDVLDRPCFKALAAAVVAVPDRHVLLPAVVAEMKSIESLVALAFRQKDLAVEDDFADAVGLDGRVRAARAGNELV